MYRMEQGPSREGPGALLGNINRKETLGSLTRQRPLFFLSQHRTANVSQSPNGRGRFAGHYVENRACELDGLIQTPGNLLPPCVSQHEVVNTSVPRFALS